MSEHHSNQADTSSILLLSSPQAAKLLGISPRKLWELANCGEIPCVRIGRCLRFRTKSLEEWIEKQERKAR